MSLLKNIRSLFKLKNKKSHLYPIFVVVLIGSFLFLADITWAQDTLGTQSLEGTGLATSSDIRVIIANIIRIILGFLGTVAFTLFLYAGFLYMTAGGNADKIERAKLIIRNALIGLVVILSAYGIVTFILSALVGGSIGNGGAGGGGGPGGGLGASSARDAIESHFPPENAKNIPRNTKVIVTFFEKIKLSSIVDDNGTPNDLTDDHINENVVIRREQDSPENALAPESVLVRFTPDQKSFVFDPIELLGNSRDNTKYVVQLKSGIEDINDQGVFGSFGFYEWSFEVSTEIDTTPPRVENVIPIKVPAGDEPKTYARNIVVQITFNEAVDPTAASGLINVATQSGALTNFQNIEIFRSGSNGTRSYFEGAFSISNQYKTVEFLTTDKCGVNSCGQDVFCLPGNSSIGVDIIPATLSDSPPESSGFPYDGVVDVAGNSFDGNEDGVASGPGVDNFDWLFKTNNTIDLIPPTINKVVPGRYSVNVPSKSNISATFSKPLLFKSVTRNTILVNDLSYYVESEPISDTGAEVFWKHGGMAESFVYNPEVTSGVRDLYQNCFNPCVGPDSSSMADARSRDDAKRIDLVLIKNALEEYNQKFGTYEVKGGGFRGTGTGWVTFADGDNYPKTILQVLIEETSLKDRVSELSALAKDESTRAHYMLYTCLQGRTTYSLSGQMEDSSNFSDPDLVAAACNGGKTNGDNPNGIFAKYGQNFVLTNFNSLDPRGEQTARDTIRKEELTKLDQAIIAFNRQNNSFPLAANTCASTRDPGFINEIGSFLDPIPFEGVYWDSNIEKQYVYVNFGDKFAVLSGLEFTQDKDFVTREVANCTPETLNGLYHYCVGGACDQFQRISNLEQ